MSIDGGIADYDFDISDEDNHSNNNDILTDPNLYQQSKSIDNSASDSGVNQDINNVANTKPEQGSSEDNPFLSTSEVNQADIASNNDLGHNNNSDVDSSTHSTTNFIH